MTENGLGPITEFGAAIEQFAGAQARETVMAGSERILDAIRRSGADAGGGAASGPAFHVGVESSRGISGWCCPRSSAAAQFSKATTGTSADPGPPARLSWPPLPGR